MDREITVPLTPRLVRWTFFYQLRPVLFICFIWVVGSLWNIVFLLLHGIQLTWQEFTSLAPYLLIAFWFLWMLYASYKKNLAQIGKMKNPIVHYRLTDEYLYVQNDLSSGQTVWGAFKGLNKKPKIWFVMTDQGASHIFPVELLDDELKAFLETKLPKFKGNRRLSMLVFWILLAVLILYFLHQMR